ncbi:MAG: MFS transporter, partial [Bdellovibrionia bacterium]
MQKNKSALTIIFLTVFIDLVGFGIIIPLSPYLAKTYGATPFEVGLLMAIYSLAQFIFSPIWGRLSDRIGRRPVILISLFGTGIAHLIFAWSTTLEMLFISRAFAGIAGGNLSAAMAYVADVTGTKDRSKGMGMIGAAFGLGFILGPVLGGILGELGGRISEAPPFGVGFPALGAAILCLANFAVATRVLTESLPPEKRNKKVGSESRFERITEYFRRPVIGPLLLISFLSIFAFAQMEAVLFLLVH